ASFAGPVSALATDGKNVFIAIEEHGTTHGEIDVVPGAGGTPKTLVADRAHPSNLVYDARFGLFYTEWSKGVELVPAASASGGVATPVKVLAVKAPTSLALGPDHLFVASDPGEPNQKKGELLRYPLSKIKTP